MHGPAFHDQRSPRLAEGCSRPGRSAFSLLELLAVIAILAVLAGILIPLIIKARSASMQVVCLGRLKDLALATLSYQTEHRVLPEPATTATSTGPGTAVLSPTPQMIDTRLLGRLQKYLKHPPVTQGTSLNDLPPQLQCPFVESDDQRGPFTTLDPGVGQFYTGYSYLGRIEEVPQPSPALASLLGITLPPLPIPLPPVITGLPLPSPPPINLGPLQIQVGVALKPARAATAQLQKNAVIWADDVHWESGSGGYWQYGHTRGRAASGPKPLTRLDAKALAGQHRAFSSGSVEWVPYGDLQIPDAPPTPALLDLSASFKIGSGSSYWWY